jgi:hypothetical protein
MAGASGTLLSKKLGIRAAHSVVLLGAPPSARVAQRMTAELGDEVRIHHTLRRRPGDLAVDAVVIYIDRLADLERRMPHITHGLHPLGQVWVAWRARRAADVNEDILRRVALAAGLADTRVIELDDVWMALRLVWRPENRDAMSYRINRSSLGLAAHRRTRRAPRRTSGAGSTARRVGRKRTD